MQEFLNLKIRNKYVDSNIANLTSCSAQRQTEPTFPRLLKERLALHQTQIRLNEPGLEKFCVSGQLGKILTPYSCLLRNVMIKYSLTVGVLLTLTLADQNHLINSLKST